MNTFSIIISPIASVLILYMAAFIIIKNWRDQVNRYLFFYLLMVFGIIFTMFITYLFPDAYYLTQINRLTQFFTVMFFASVFAMSLVFPKPEKHFPFYLTLIILVPALVIAAIAGFTDLTISRAYFEDGVLKRDFKYGYYIYASAALIYLFLGILNFIRKYIKTTVAIYKLQLIYVFIGNSIAAIVASIFAIILPRFFNYSEMYVVGPSIAAVIGASSIFYSAANLNLMDLSSAIQKTPMYIISSVFAIFPIYGILYAFKGDYPVIGNFPSHIISVSVVMVFIFFYVFIHPRIHNFFTRKEHEFEVAVDNFVNEVDKFQSAEFIIQKTVDVLYESLQAERVLFITLNDKSRKYELMYYRIEEAADDFTMEPIERSSTLVRWFVRNHQMLNKEKIYIDDELFENIREDMAEFYESNKIEVILPIYQERRLFSLLCIGNKKDSTLYSFEEMDKLADFFLKCNDFISTAFFYRKAMQEQLISRTRELSSFILSRSVPALLPNTIGIKFGAFMIPRYEEGIDYFDFIRLGDNGIGVIATDVSGMGVNSALYSVLLRSSFRSCINEAPSTYTVMQTLNKAIYEYSKGRGGLVTAYYLFYDIKNMRLMYTNAGFPALEVFRVDKGDYDTLDSEGIPLGYNAEASYGIGRTNMQKEDIGILYSKSLLSSKNEEGQEFGLVRLRNIIRDNRTRRPSEIARIFNNNYREFMGAGTPDSDVFVLIFKIV